MYNILEIMYIADSKPVLCWKEQTSWDEAWFCYCHWFKFPGNSVTVAFTVVSILLLFFLIFSENNYPVKILGVNYVMSSLYDWFQRDVISIIPFKKQRFFVFFYVLFLLILFSNTTGLVPFSDTVTMFWLVNLYFSLSTQIGITLLGLYYNNFNFIKAFLPSNIPFTISLLLIPTEFLSYISRILSLAIRLFANMFAGHTMLKIVSCFIWAALFMGPCGGLWSIVPLVLFFFVLILEVLVSVLQAYVFINLTLIYIKLNLNLH